ncbi:MAG: ATP-dependent RecD-like DNA helicase [Roseburia sp.]|nr:ATP-dependent RecD-like DNA helicase [Roseburia sp.]MCM1278305.1 ATP-dependent RecD-like DNA helicase [Robinsoniella sp.]
METLTGYVEHIIYRNEENGYTVFQFAAGKEEFVLVGCFQTIENGENFQVTGSFVEHPTYGSQFKVESYESRLPEDTDSMKRYLGSGAIKGIGPSLAEKIVKKFGMDTFRIMEEEPERLAEIKGISERKAREIAVQAEEKKDMKEAMIFLQGYGISNTLAVKIYNTYGEGLYSMIRENPYRMSEDMHGVGFRIADEIARKAGIHTDSDYRIRSGLLYMLSLGISEGHTYLPMEMLLEKTAALLEIEKGFLEPQVSNLAMDKKVIVKSMGEGNVQVYGSNAYYCELSCGKMLHDLNIMEKEEPEEEEKLLSRIKAIEEQEGMQLDDLQRKGVLASVRRGIFILTGGPGTGKTTTIHIMLRLFEELGMDFCLAAPTGRAAKRMTEATGYEAKTIHRLLELNGGMSEERGSTYFERNEENPLEVDAIIIDEMSMVDIYLFQALLKAVSPGTRLILVGDRNQLPSVGPGKVLKDMIESDCFFVVKLEKIFRQSEESHIVLNAHRIHKGEEIALDNKSRDFFFLERNDVNVIYKHMVQLITEKLPRYVNAKPYDIQVLTPVRKGALGVETLNKILQTYLNPESPRKKEHIYGETLFREGDKVMQVKNNYKIQWEIVSKYHIPIDKGTGVFNGDMGIIKEINSFGEELVVEYEEGRLVTYPFAQLDELELAYAITIHKSQGSEYPAVIMPLLTGPKLLMNRNLLYTGITRAKECVTILGSRNMISLMIANENEHKRYAGLKDRIIELA